MNKFKISKNKLEVSFAIKTSYVSIAFEVNPMAKYNCANFTFAVSLFSNSRALFKYINALFSLPTD